IAIPRLLGTLGMIGAPFLAISMALQPADRNSQVGQILEVFFMLGFYALLFGLASLGAFGRGKGRIALWLQLTTLSVASLWTLSQAIKPGLGEGSLLYGIGDAGWPINMLMTLVTGITVATVGRMTSWRRYAALACGLALPLLFASMAVLGHGAGGTFFSIYVAVTWAALGYAIRSEPAMS
ncbi:MAG: hypothetical protein QOJ65_2301, partial [Fimbriimonadaceae bacterium]|nr:hypothetical protein [Fimbriimonadaceae bacterium]